MCRFRSKARQTHEWSPPGWAHPMRADWRLEQALAFIRSAFILPRKRGEDQQALEAADWMCVTIYERFIPGQNGPIGPLVAVDARRSPAIWESDDALPLPSLFRVQSSLLERTAAPDSSETVLAYFPVICMPSSLTVSPEYFPLLSHEVGPKGLPAR